MTGQPLDISRARISAQTNLLHTPGELFGRESALEAVEALIEGGAKIVTVVGPPGVGKSRLMEALGWRFLAQGRLAELWWVSLRELEDEAQITQALCELLHIAPDEAPAAERLGRVLEQRDVWFLLDNAEHVARDVARLAALLTAHGCRLLVTSREPLGVAAEVVFALEPLEASGADSPAVALLAARAGARLGAVELDACAKLAQRFDGLPLALELIAPRLRMIKPQALLAQVEASPATGVTRLLALEEALELSWALLGEAEQHALACCALCVESFDVALAREVSGSVQVDEALDELCRRSLLRHQEETGRWSMLRGIQRFALARLDARGEREAAERRFVAALAKRGAALAEDSYGSPWHPLVVQALPDRASFMAAMQRAQRVGALDVWIGCALGWALTAWRAGETGLQGALAPLLAALEARGEEVSPTQRALVWRLLTDLDGIQWSVELVRPWLDEALALAPQLELRLRVTLLWHKLDAQIEAGESAQAEASLALLDALLSGCQDAYLLAYQCFMRGNYLMQKGFFSQAVACFDEALASWPGETHPYELGRVRLYRSFALQFQCETERSLEDMRAARARFEQVGDRTSQAHALRLLANYCVDEGRGEAAREAVDALMVLGRRHGLSWAWGWAHLLMGQLELDMGRYEEGCAELEQAARSFAQNRQWPFEAGALALCGLGRWLQAGSQAARPVLSQALERRDAVRSPWGHRLLDCLQIALWLEEGELERAAARLDTAPSDDNPLIMALLCVARALVAQARWRAQRRQGYTRAAVKARGELLSALAQLGGAHQRACAMSVELRLFRRLMEGMLPDELRGARLMAELEDPTQGALVVDWAQPGYRGPGMAAWEALEGHPMAAALLAALVAQHGEAPGKPLETGALCERLWGERGEQAAQRLYVLISTLRRNGLEHVIHHVPGGYMVDPAVRVITVSNPLT
jgi:tetratricopeptide (TPR) repeat protein